MSKSYVCWTGPAVLHLAAAGRSRKSGLATATGEAYDACGRALSHTRHSVAPRSELAKVQAAQNHTSPSRSLSPSTLALLDALPAPPATDARCQGNAFSNETELLTSAWYHAGTMRSQTGQ